MAARRWRLARSVEFLEGVEVLAGDAAALGQQGCEVVRPGAEGLGLFQQHRMAVEGFPECPAERHGIALRSGPLAESRSSYAARTS